jgi:SAM-dependent methyltransferase
MSDLNINLEEEIRIWQERLFARSIRRRNKQNRISALVGNTLNMQCLEISAGDGILSAGLRSLGGSWKTVVTNVAAADSLAYAHPDPVTLIDNGILPFEDATFDRLVIIDAMKGIYDDHEFIHECHRVLKNDGWVIISETRRNTFSLVALLQRLFHTSPLSKGQRRNGYTPNELFNALKDGFDVPETIVYSNGLLESFTTIGEWVQSRLFHDYYWMVKKNTEKDLLYRYRRLNDLAGFSYPLLWILSKMEFLPGHQLLVKSRRRHWRPRLQPKLIDGRSIAEAAINTKIGTAAPF